MTYRVYIKKDYKPEVIWVNKRKAPSFPAWFAFLPILVVPIAFAYWMLQSDTPDIQPITPEKAIAVQQPEQPSIQQTKVVIPEIKQAPNVEPVLAENEAVAMPVAYYQPPASTLATTDQDEIVDSIVAEYSEITLPTPETFTEVEWQSVTVKSGDSMALIFSRLGLSANELYRVMSLGQDVSRLKKIKPGQIIRFHIVDDKLLGLEYEFNLTSSLSITLQDEKYLAEVIEHELDTVVKNATATIDDSLFMSGKRAGLSDNVIMQMVAIYGWDIDFALDIRKGDSFTLIYEEKYKDGEKVAEGPILAAEFINRGNPIRALRYANADGSIDYYDDNGDAMRKAFLRTPVNFTRISSRFSLGRKHPILNKIRAHKGVDYAAPTGTPIKATGDGTVVHAGRKGGYGKTVILKHGGNYSTVYAHLHKYANGIRSGKRVKQGQIIGYVGMSGLATGPHLHYEFRINGVHRNPLTVELPHVESIAKQELPSYQQTILPMLAELDRLTGRTSIASQPSMLSENMSLPSSQEGG